MLKENTALSVQELKKILGPHIINVLRILKLPIFTDRDLKEYLQCINFDNDLKRCKILQSSLPQSHREKPQTKEIKSNDVVVTPTYALFEHQRKLKLEVLSKLDNVSKLLLHMPTGTGKTRTAWNIIADYMRKYPSATIIWLANRDELCQQAAQEATRAWESLGDHTEQIVTFQGQDKAEKLYAWKQGIIIAGLQKMAGSITNNKLLNSLSKNQNTLIVIDEAHIAVASTYRCIVTALHTRNQYSKLLGLTATPGRSWNNKSEDKELAELFDSNLVGLESVGYNNPIEFLTNKGFIAKVEFTDLESSLPSIQDEGKNEYKNSTLQVIANNPELAAATVTQLKDKTANHSRIIVFTATVQQAMDLALLLNAKCKAKIAEFITAETPKSQRTKIVEWYKADSREPRILINHEVLTAGFDAPKTSCVFILRPTKSLVLYSQMVGRAIRGVKAGGNEKAQIITLVDTTLPGFRTIKETFSNWNDIWKKTKK